MTFSCLRRFLQHPTKIQKGQRGAKPHCMRNLHISPPRLAPDPPAPSPQMPQPPTSNTPRLSPGHSRPPSLSPPATDDVTPRNSSPGQGAGSPPGRHMTLNPRSLPSTPVHMFPASSVSRRSSVSPGVDEHVRSSLKDHLVVRQMIQAKLEMEEAPPHVLREELLRRRQHQHLEMLQQQQQQRQCDQPGMMEGGGVESYDPKMDCDYQEEPEDLSLKPSPWKDPGFSVPRGNPASLPLPSPSAGYTPAYSPGRFASRPSPSHPPDLYFPAPRSFTPPSTKRYSPPPPPPPVNGANNNSDDSNHEESKEAMGCLVVPSAPARSRTEECGFVAVTESSAMRTDSVTVVKTEPMHAPLS